MKTDLMKIATMFNKNKRATVEPDDAFKKRVLAVFENMNTRELFEFTATVSGYNKRNAKREPELKISKPGAGRVSGEGRAYPGATGIFIDNKGGVWQVMMVPGSPPENHFRPTYYMKWADGDPGGSFLEKDGVYIESAAFWPKVLYTRETSK